MTPMIVGLLIFFAVHAVPMEQGLRNGLVERFGATTYRLAFSILSLIGLVIIIIGYHKLQLLPGKNPQIWVPPAWMSHVTILFMVFAMILLVAAYVPSNIKRIVGHPMLAAVKIWAFSHLLVNGDLGSMILFGSFLTYAILDRVSLKKRAAHPTPHGEVSVSAARNGGARGDAIVVILGLGLYVMFLFFLHKWLIGVSPMSMMGH